MDMDNKSGKMARSMMDNGKQIKLMAKGRSYMEMVIYMKASG